jgi:hypothetical protein
MDASLHFITFSMTNRDVILLYAMLHCGMTRGFFTYSMLFSR